MQTWSGFFATIAAVSATLLGLLFVAISINAAQSLGPGQQDGRRLVEQGFQNYFVALLVALVALLPDMSLPTLGLVGLSIAFAGTVWVLVRFWQSLRAGKGRGSSVRRHVASVLGFGMLIYSALRMRWGHPNHDILYIFASALIVLISSATLVSWELLLRISRIRPSR